MPSITDLDSVRLSSTSLIGEFSCGDADLDEFLHEDACDCLQELIAVTYLFKDGNTTAAFFSVLNDKIVYDCPLISKSAWKRFLRLKFPHPKRGYESYPSVKLGRLGVHTQYAGTGLGTEILDLIKMSFITDNKTGYRFITVDAYNNEKTIRFYEKNGFKFFPSDSIDTGQKTRLMYFDLRPFRDALVESGTDATDSEAYNQRPAISEKL